MKLINGKELSKKIRIGIKRDVERLKNRFGTVPCLHVILVGDDRASKIYIKQKKTAAEEVGIKFEQTLLPEKTTEDELIRLIERLNSDDNVHGILVQLPLPGHINESCVFTTVSRLKDVDGLNPANIGNVLLGQETLAPCTPMGIVDMLEKAGISMEGKEVVIVNHSNIVGKPLAMMLLNRNATVTVCHVKTKDLKEHTRKADILITATGVQNLVKNDMVKDGVVVIDAGITKTEKGVVGDVDFDDVKEKTSLITPVPGGVGPMTVAMVLKNTVKAMELQKEHDKSKRLF